MSEAQTLQHCEHQVIDNFTLNSFLISLSHLLCFLCLAAIWSLREAISSLTLRYSYIWCWQWICWRRANRKQSTDDIRIILKFQKFIAQLIYTYHFQLNIISIQPFQMMLILIGVVVIVGVVVVGIAGRVDWRKYRDRGYYEVTLFLGSGGHTGELCQLLNGFKIDKVNKLNVIITESDKSSEGFFRNYLTNNHADIEQSVLSKLRIHYLPRTNQVKKSYLSSGIKILYSTLRAWLLIVLHLINTTHFVSNGPGTSVPFFYHFFLLKLVRLSRAKLIYFESWCRVVDLSVTGKLVKPIVNQMVVCWPELAAKYKDCKYMGRIV